MSDEDTVAELRKLKMRLDAQERAITTISAYMTHDPGWAGFRDRNLENWLTATTTNTAITEEEKKVDVERHAELERLLRPKTNLFRWS